MSWKDNKDLGPWEFEKSSADNRYNEGNLISSASDPTWDLDTKRGTPITNSHAPCGYWTKSYAPNPPSGIIEGILYSTGSNINAGTGHSISESTLYYFTKIPSVESIVWKDQIASSSSSMGIREDGTLWCWGTNQFGELGINSYGTTKYYEPIRQPYGKESTKFIKVTCGGLYTLAIQEDGTLWGCGYNNAYNLGLGYNSLREVVFKQEATSSTWLDISCDAGRGTMGIKSDSTLWIVGSDPYGYYGMGSTGGWNDFTQVSGINGCTAVSIANLHSVILLGEDAYSSGNNTYGQLGQGDFTNRNIFTSIPGKWNKIIAYNNSTFGIKNDGTLWSCGNNDKAQLGLGLDPSISANQKIDTMTQVGADTNWSNIAIGTNYSIGLKTDGTLWGCGTNTGATSPGGLGLGSGTVEEWSMTQIGSDTDWVDIKTGKNGISFALKEV